jgi:ribosomal-protein-alanine N-acetyltransferase
MNISIRAATLADLDIIFEVERASATAAHWAKSEYEKAINDPSRLVLVAENSGVIGLLVAFTAAQEWELENIAVSPAARRHGAGRALVNALISRAQDAGATEIRQEIRVSNIPAQKLGQAVGFIQEGCRRNYYNAPVEDALLFKYLVRPHPKP